VKYGIVYITRGLYCWFCLRVCFVVQSIKRSVRLNDGTMGFAEVITIKVTKFDYQLLVYNVKIMQV